MPVTPERVAVVVLPPRAGRQPAAAVVGAGVRRSGPLPAVLEVVRHLERDLCPRWVWWRAEVDAAPLVADRLPLARCWDIAEVHRLLAGGWEATAQLAWATASGLPTSTLPPPSTGDLFDVGGAGPPLHGTAGTPVRDDGHLHPDAGSALWPVDAPGLLAWAETALECAARQARALATVGPRALATAHAESAAALLCLELQRDGLPLDRAAAEHLIAEAAGPRPRSEAHARQVRAERDAAVLRHVPGRESTDLRNPLQVRELLASVGIDVPSTRKWVLAPFRQSHPVVEELLRWRKAERIATTYGYTWLAEHVGPDDRLRGRWTACDGAAGRMTAQNGLHNLPTALRPAVAAEPGHVLVRADLGQIEPRVLAAVSGDPAFAAATAADDLYAPVAAALGVDRPRAKVAVLAAMYGQRSGAAGEALKGLQRAYPIAMAHLDRAYAAGLRRQPVRTFGGRLIPLDRVLPGPDAGDAVAGGAAEGSGERPDDRAGQARDAARGRFARNAVIQGAAAELFKAWAVTVRATTGDLGAQVVLCLHDELLVQVPQQHAAEATRRLEQALTDSARRWSGGTQVRFVAETAVVQRWSEAAS